MQENNETEENTQNSSESNEPLHAAGDVFHPEAPADQAAGVSQPEAVPEPVTPPVGSQPTPEVLSIPPQPVKPKKSKKKLIIGLLVALLLIGGAAAYWFTRDTKTDSNSTATTTKETQDVELIRIGTAEGPASIYFPDETNVGIQNIIDRQIYEGLVGLSDNKIVPLVAQSWTNPDEKTWVFKLRPNIKFHTGNPVTAKAVKASLDSLKQYDVWGSYVSTIESTEATGDLEVTIKTKQPDALLLNRLALAFISDLSVKNKAGNDGTGAYQVDTTAKNDKISTTLKAVDSYYLGHVKTRKLVYHVYNTDEDIVNALNKGEIDMAETVPIPAVKELVKGKDYGSFAHVSPGTFGVYMNQIRAATPIMKNKDFRTALALAMNRQELVDKTGNRSESQTQVIPKSLPGYDASIGFPSFDLKAAKAALTKSGYKNEPIEFIYVRDIQVDSPIIIEQMKALGINVVVKDYKAEDVGLALDVLAAGKFDLFSGGYTSDISDSRDILGALLNSKESSYPIYNDPAYDKLLTDSDKTFDPAARLSMLQQANKYIIDNVAWIPLRTSGYISYYPKDLDIHNSFNGGGNIGAYYWQVGRIVN